MAGKKGSRGRSGSERLVVPEIGLTDAGSVRVLFRPEPPAKSFYGQERRLAALIYELAAELERRCEELGTRWAISPEPFHSRLDVELGENEDPEPAAELVATVLADAGVA